MSNEQYGVAQIAVLSQREHVRLRPAMYIGTVSEPRGLAQMAFEIIDNAVDEHEAGHGAEIDVHVAADFTVTVVDHGRGIPVGPHPTAKGPDGEPLNTLTVVLGTLNAGGKFRTGEDGEGYGTGTIGMHGVGSSVVQMLSDRFEVTVRRDGGVWRQAFSRGLPTTPVERVGDLADPNDTGTTIVYHPDPEVFRQTLNPGERLPARLEEIASLNAGLRIHYVNDDAGVDEVFVHEDGLAGLVLRDLGERQRLHDRPFVVRGVYDGGPEHGRISVDAAFIYDDDPEPGSSIRTFANNVGTVEGGTHKAGLKAGLREVISARAQALKLTKTALETRYIEDGLHAAVSVKLRSPEMEGQTKTKLGNKVAATAVETVLRDGLAELARDQAWATALDAVAARAVRTREAEEAARRARSVARSTKAVAKAERLPSKLAECVWPVGSYRELVVVEGASASGSAKEGRFREFQAILPLRGKILNVSKADLERALSSETIRTLIVSIGTGIGREFSIKGLRYSKIIIMTDADVDGSHIRSLLLTFLYYYMRPLIAGGHVYAAVPPLYRVIYGDGSSEYLEDDQALAAFRKRSKNKKFEISRYKGLGEMNPEQLRETTLDPSKRLLRRITIEDAAKAARSFDILMGKNAAPRWEFIVENALRAETMNI